MQRKFVAWRLALLALLWHVQAAALPPEQPIVLDTAGGTLAGTLQLPEGGGKRPVALIIAGSGPTDRDGNNPQVRNDSLKQLASQLAAAGYATVRYDKRGVGASAAAAPGEALLRFETYVDDATAWVRKLKEDGRFAFPLVIGHSEGSLIGMLAAQRAGAGAFISIAGPAESAGTALRKQLAGKLPADLAAENERVLGALEQGRTVEKVSPALQWLYRPSVQPYLLSWFRYVPARSIQALQVPVLIVQGGADLQVPTDQAHALRAARPDAVMAVIGDMNHVLKQVHDPAGQQAAYTDPRLPLHPALLPALTSFLGTVR